MALLPVQIFYLPLELGYSLNELKYCSHLMRPLYHYVPSLNYSCISTHDLFGVKNECTCIGPKPSDFLGQYLPLPSS